MKDQPIDIEIKTPANIVISGATGMKLFLLIEKYILFLLQDNIKLFLDIWRRRT